MLPQTRKKSLGSLEKSQAQVFQKSFPILRKRDRVLGISGRVLRKRGKLLRKSRRILPKSKLNTANLLRKVTLDPGKIVGYWLGKSPGTWANSTCTSKSRRRPEKIGWVLGKRSHILDHIGPQKNGRVFGKSCRGPGHSHRVLSKRRLRLEKIALVLGQRGHVLRKSHHKPGKSGTYLRKVTVDFSTREKCPGTQESSSRILFEECYTILPIN